MHRAKSNSNKKPLCVTLDKEIVDIIEEISKKNGISKSYIVNKILRDYFKDFIDVKKEANHKVDKIIDDVLKTHGVM